MSNPDDLTPEELAEQEAELLPDREAMSVIQPGMPADHPLPPVPIDGETWGNPAPPPMAE